MKRSIMTPGLWAALVGSVSVFVFAATWWLKAPALACLVLTVALVARRSVAGRRTA